MDQTDMTLSSWDLLPSRVSLWGGCSCPPMASDWLLSPQKREAFCQLLQLMKNKHSKQDEPDMISVFIGTWNMGSVPPPKSVTSWFTSKGLGKTLDEVTVTIPHDIYVFGTQENSVGDREWLDLLRGGLKELTDLDYRPVRGGSSCPVSSPHTPLQTILLDLTGNTN